MVRDTPLSYAGNAAHTEFFSLEATPAWEETRHDPRRCRHRIRPHSRACVTMKKLPAAPYREEGGRFCDRIPRAGLRTRILEDRNHRALRIETETIETDAST